MEVFGLYLSTYIVVIISIDRCMAILDPLSKNRAPRRVKLMIVVAWTLSAVFSLPQVVRLNLSPVSLYSSDCPDQLMLMSFRLLLLSAP